MGVTRAITVGGEQATAYAFRRDFDDKLPRAMVSGAASRGMPNVTLLPGLLVRRDDWL